MNRRKIIANSVGGALIAAAAAFAPAVHADKKHLDFSVSIGGPGYGLTVGNAPYYGGYGGNYGGHYGGYQSGYYAPYRDYYRPHYRPYYRPVIVAPPVYYAPPPVVYVPRPVYYAPRPSYYGSTYGYYDSQDYYR